MRITTTTNFDDWLQANRPSKVGGLFNLALAIRRVSYTNRLEYMDGYKIRRRDSKVFVRGPVSVLVLVNADAERAFLRVLDHLASKDVFDVDGLVDDLEAFERKYGRR